MFASGHFARDLFAQGADAAIAEAKSLLAKIFGTDILKEITAPRKATSWVSDPWILGAYSVLSPGGGEARAELAQSDRRPPVLRRRSDIDRWLLDRARRL